MTKAHDCSGGMSKAWRFLTGHNPPWQGCCDAHDTAYEIGGTREDRKRADQALRACVEKNGHPVWAWLMYAAVRVGKSPILPWRKAWKYGPSEVAQDGTV